LEERDGRGGLCKPVTVTAKEVFIGQENDKYIMLNAQC
jgi:hypothetical protein